MTRTDVICGLCVRVLLCAVMLESRGFLERVAGAVWVWSTRVWVCQEARPLPGRV